MDWPFYYSTPYDDSAIIGAKEAQTATINISSDADFVANYVQAIFKNALLLVKIAIDGRALCDNKAWPLVANFVGGGGLQDGSTPYTPFRLVLPFVFPASTAITIDYQDKSGAENFCYFTFIGYKRFSGSAPVTKRK